ncbi:type VI secretion system contractile sheath small subunit [Chromobacterium amazonense]|uniref:Type VI secretion system contractile sheath small subunit n=1 Tax=Chromobacterium amazonense TaxID=1382803 RepID=A0A1S1X7G5_9NEIS|nr:type VI secretion system contractile sheath small subunit [Chromobacterium amazonense]MBM2885254.1 type VI secretion system contractile sheath small subunit [Chromobacterium amazonense]MDE1713141.1 type VI secretion system contractile sheath small subunit [Chromobacterium amazonense]MDQ4541113.1 type VI secretion system contractile sheath small subunit [Chromobacterium amazonense]OHX15448.1 type VI secretion system-associated protein [Chromobacterium amazonense]PRP72036.1 type VI secretion 
MGKESTQKKLSRVRPPRVQITYDVEIGDAIETKELPFVLGVLGDYSGHSKEPLPKMKERKFVQIDRDNFDEVLKGMAPRLAMKVDNALKDDGSQLGVELNFESLSDFEPQNVVRQIDPLNQLLEARSRLADLRNKLSGNDKLEELLDEVVRDTEKLRQIGQQAGKKEGGEQ